MYASTTGGKQKNSCTTIFEADLQSDLLEERLIELSDKCFVDKSKMKAFSTVLLGLTIDCDVIQNAEMAVMDGQRSRFRGHGTI
jgi:uncharacterized Fe-S center protein